MNPWRHRHLIWLLAARDLKLRYRGSWLGTLWAVINPLLMLAAFTFVFGVLVPARWATPANGQATFALTLFAGLIVFWLFSDCLTRAPNLVVDQAYLVAKAGFPLEVLTWAVIAGALIHAAIGFVVLLAAALAIVGPLPWTAVLLPLVMLPLVPLLAGLCWLLSATGVFLRDIAQMVSLLVLLLMFLSPIFYPLTAFPEAARGFVYLNPVALIVEQVRAVVLWGRVPDWPALGLYGAIGLAMAGAGRAWFRRLRPHFADVL